MSELIFFIKIHIPRDFLTKKNIPRAYIVWIQEEITTPNFAQKVNQVMRTKYLTIGTIDNYQTMTGIQRCQNYILWKINMVLEYGPNWKINNRSGEVA